jgi:pyruvate formate lyase activating enzyme
MKEAMLYTRRDDGKAACVLCSRRCVISDGDRGFCNVRLNRGGSLYTLTYGSVIARHVDPIEKKPLFHFLPGSFAYSIATMGCNFRCYFCQNWEISQYQDKAETVPGRPLPPETAVEEALRSGCLSIAYTYTEPTIFFEYAYDIAVLAHKRGLKNIFVTNGYQTAETIQKMKGVIDAANVDLKSFSDEFYRRVCSARLRPVLEAIPLLHEAGLHLEITTLVVPDQNDSEEELTEIAHFIAGISPDIPWHVSRFYPNYQDHTTPPTPRETIRKAVTIGRQQGLRYVFAGNLPGEGDEDTLCPHCGERVIPRSGYSIRAIRLKGNRCGNCGTPLPIVIGDE